jgi:hypothetical protein
VSTKNKEVVDDAKITLFASNVAADVFSGGLRHLQPANHIECQGDNAFPHLDNLSDDG